MKIEARNAYAYINHTKILAYLSGKDEPADLRNYAYSVTGEEIYHKLRRLESQAHRLAELECNGDIDEDKAEKQSAAIEKKVRELLPRLSHFDNNGRKGKFFINGDPRGYALKMGEEAAALLTAIMLGISPYTDWGGYVVLCPEF